MEELEKPSWSKKTEDSLPCCIFCRHYIPGEEPKPLLFSFFPGTLPRCSKCRDYVNATPVDCFTARQHERFCGHLARFYEKIPKPEPEPKKSRSWWKRLLCGE